MTLPKGVPLWAAVVALAGALALTLWTVPTTFDISARTERVWLVPSAEHVSQWHLESVKLFEGFDEKGRDFTGSVRFELGVDVRFERLGLGPLRIRGQAAEAAPVATLHDESDEPAGVAKGWLVILVDDVRKRAEAGQVLAMPVTGKVEFGRRIATDSGLRPSLLRDGTIMLLGHSVLGSTRFVSGSVALVPGDHVAVDTVGPFSGIVAVNENRRSRWQSARSAAGRRVAVRRRGLPGPDEPRLADRERPAGHGRVGRLSAPPRLDDLPPFGEERMRATALGLFALIAGAAGAGCATVDPTFVVQPGAAARPPRSRWRLTPRSVTWPSTGPPRDPPAAPPRAWGAALRWPGAANASW